VIKKVLSIVAVETLESNLMNLHSALLPSGEWTRTNSLSYKPCGPETNTWVIVTENTAHGDLS